MEDLTALKYPIGKVAEQPYTNAEPGNAEALAKHLADIQLAPSVLENAILNLDEAQLNTHYRPGGWTVKQVVHHVADSHMNAFMRFKLALTEDNPVIKPYDENEWVKLPDTQNVPVNVSLTLLHALHKRWYELLKNMTDQDYKRTVFHPEHKREFTLWQLLNIYAWHGKHHAAHITSLRERNGW